MNDYGLLLKSLDLASQPELRILNAKNNLLRSVELDKNLIGDEGGREIHIEIEKNLLSVLDLTSYDDITISCDNDILRLLVPILKFNKDTEKIVKRMKFAINQEVYLRNLAKTPHNWDITFTPRNDNA